MIATVNGKHKIGIVSLAATLAICAFSLGSAHVALAAGGNTYTVTVTTDDSGSPACTAGSTTDPDCDLRTAIADASADGATSGDPDIIQFASGLGPVMLDLADNGDLAITDTNVVIEGNGDSSSGTVINGGGSGNESSMFYMGDDNESSLTLEDVEVTDYVNSSEYGEGIVNVGNDASATLTDDDFFDNNTTDSYGGVAGGPVVNSYFGTVTVNGSVFDDNSAIHDGGAIHTNGGSLTVENSLFEDNSADNGGAIANGGDLTVEQSLFTENSGNGAAIYQYEKDSETIGADISNSTIAANEASEGASAIDNATEDYDIYLYSDTIADNTVSTEGNSAIEGDEEDSIVTTNSIFQSAGSADPNCNVVGVLESSADGHNLDSDGTCDLTGGEGNVSDESADLQSALTNNGGPTDSLALLTGSPALEAGDNTDCAAAQPDGAGGVDQRGVSRPQATTCDMGAFEDAGSTTGATVVTATPNSNDTVSVTVTVTADNSDAGTPEGTVTLSDPGDSSVSGSGTANFTIGPLAAGTYTLTATYTPSNGFLPSTGSTTVTIAAATVPVPSTGTNGLLPDAVAGLALILIGGACGVALLPLKRKRIALQ